MPGKRIADFDNLVPQAAKVHFFTFCEKKRHKRETRSLRGYECCNCFSFVLNGGTCDPV